MPVRRRSRDVDPDECLRDLRSTMRQLGLTPWALSRELGVAPTTVDRWLAGQPIGTPRMLRRALSDLRSRGRLVTRARPDEVVLRDCPLVPFRFGRPTRSSVVAARWRVQDHPDDAFDSYLVNRRDGWTIIQLVAPGEKPGVPGECVMIGRNIVDYEPTTAQEQERYAWRVAEATAGRRHRPPDRSP